jgi:enoyl-[acyl-carrier protein] reductase II
MLAVMVLGAAGVQIGSRFVASVEASSHIQFKEKVINTGEGDTQLSLKGLTPVRLIKNNFFQQVQEAENAGATLQVLESLLGKGRAKKGMFEGDMENGELEIGQVAALITQILPAADIVKEIWTDFEDALKHPLQ